MKKEPRKRVTEKFSSQFSLYLKTDYKIKNSIYIEMLAFLLDVAWEARIELALPWVSTVGSLLRRSRLPLRHSHIMSMIGSRSATGKTSCTITRFFLLTSIQIYSIFFSVRVYLSIIRFLPAVTCVFSKNPSFSRISKHAFVTCPCARPMGILSV